MWKFCYLFSTILTTLYFLNYKFSKGIRVVAYREEEKPIEAIASFVLMVAIALLWTIYFVVF